MEKNIYDLNKKSIEISLEREIECTVCYDGTFYNTATQTSHQKDEMKEIKRCKNLYGYCTIKEEEMELFNSYSSYGSSSVVIFQVRISDLKEAGIKEILPY